MKHWECLGSLCGALESLRHCLSGSSKRGSDADLIFYDCEPYPETPIVERAPLEGPKLRVCARRCRRRAEAPRSAPAARVEVARELAACNVDGFRAPSLEALSEKKRKLLLEMRARVAALPAGEAPPPRNDVCLKRFLAHGKWNVDEGMRLFLEMEAWRRKVGADRILEEFPDGKVNKVVPIDLTGFYPYSFDRHHRAVAWMRVGHLPWWRPLFELIEEGERSQLWMTEYYMACTVKKAKETGMWMERSVVLVDLSQLDFNYFQGLAGSGRARRRGALQAVAQYYPGIVDKAYIINAPGFANRAWNICKIFLSKQLMEKAELVATDDERRAMVQELGAENVPRALGGESDECTYDMAEHLRMPREGWKAILDAWRPREIVIAARVKHEEVVSVPARGRARWQWALQESSIFFEVSRRRPGGDFEIVSQSEERTFLDLEDPVCGEVSAPDGGCEVRLVWDNSASRMWSKTLLLRLEVL